ncbi:MAG: hypothetical protein OQK94_00875 [Gammaproteobacteria bacterium]|nr:hypothetical protein [Gammaproteobacteria bacterium]MCW8839893.1 hypothetical protein [Gammaproteobacteria bacterium]MCW8958935.1 hypothetical protein [Gammaproteobacteria bacterium]MCW8972644.1 hypothetical protein [Gammaproteobacteria bacterium]MCW8992391.1 hypothetical protein [Gammaproteobacteria bacterium]
MEGNRSSRPRGTLSSYLGENTRYGDAVADIESALGIDDKFPPQAACSVVTTIIGVIESGALKGAPNPERINQWLEALKAVHATALQKTEWTQAGPSGRDGGNPLYGRYEDYPIPSFLLQPPDHALTAQAEGLLNIFIVALAQKPDEEHGNEAKELRLAIRPASSRRAFVTKLPAFSTYPEYHPLLTATLDHIESSDARGAEHALNLAMRRLVGLGRIPRVESDDAVQPGSVRIKGWQNQHSEIGGGLEKSTLEGTVADLPIQDPDPDVGEAGRNILIFEADPLSPDSIGTPEEDEIDARSEESSYWISRHQRIVPNDTGRLTKPERRHFSAYLRRCIRSEIHDEQVAGVMLGLMYVTGQDLETVLKFNIGAGQHIDEAGNYHRPISSPANAYKPTSEVLSDLEVSISEIGLPLPEPLRSWVIGKLGGYSGNICHYFSETPEKIKGHIKEALDKVRENGLFFRIIQDRIAPALAIELSLKWRNPVATHLIAGREKQAAPMLSYYVVHTVDELLDMYAMVANDMMNPQ